MLRHLTIRSRLIFVIGFLSMQSIIGAVIGITSIGFANDSTKTIYDDRLVAMGQLDQVVRLLNMNQLAIAKASNGDPAAVGNRINEVQANIQTASTVWAKFMATSLTHEERRLAEQFAQDRQKFVNAGLEPAIMALRAQDAKRATEIMNGPMTQLFVPVQTGINALIQLQLDVAKNEYEQSQSRYHLVRVSCIAGVLFGVLLATIIGIWLIRAISRPLDVAVEVASGIAAGDLTQRIQVQSSDETGRLMQALKSMNDSLVKIVAQVRAGTDTIAIASTQIAGDSLDLSSRTEQQAGALEQTASSLEELTSTVKRNADNACHANDLAMTASKVANKGGILVSQVVDTMGSIHATAKKIADIISVVDGIAFQTNILALNAAVEVARAGEQGRGFAVVAAEVRSLAQRAATAAKEIKTLIDDSVAKVDRGTMLVDQAGATMQEIVDSVERVTGIMGDISAAGRQQTAGIGQINQALAYMDQITQQNASLVEEAAAASESMREQAVHLAQVVGVFKLDRTQAADREPILHKPILAQPNDIVTSINSRVRAATGGRALRVARQALLSVV